MASFAQMIMWKEMWMKRERVKEIEKNGCVRKEDQERWEWWQGKKSNDKANMGVGMGRNLKDERRSSQRFLYWMIK